MRIVYFGEIHSTDSDFPLVKALLSKGIDVYYFIPLVERFKRAGIIDITKIDLEPGIYNATLFNDLNCYKEYIDLSKVYFIYYKEGRKHISTWVTIIKAFFYIKKLNADILHIVWPLDWLWTILYKLKIPIVQMVHDPIRHSNRKSIKEENYRKRAFNSADELVLLNPVQKKEFELKYKILPTKVSISRLGEFDYLKCFSTHNVYSGKYVLFFGQIFPYKGLEYLCEAMLHIHKLFPDVKLIIAGKGNLYFDFSPYEVDYIEIKNEYISVPDLACLLRGCLFCVCPYTDATQSGVLQTAFSLNVPAIVTNVGGLSQDIIDNVNGKIVPPKDVNGLYNAMIDLLENPRKIEYMRNYIRDNWSKRMKWLDIADDYITLYNKLSHERI